MQHDLDDLVGPAEIARRLDVNRPTVSMWQRRSSLTMRRKHALPFPDPIISPSGRRLFSWRQVAVWAVATSRKPTGWLLVDHTITNKEHTDIDDHTEIR